MYAKLRKDYTAQGINHKETSFMPCGHVVKIVDHVDRLELFAVVRESWGGKWLYGVPSRLLDTAIPQGKQHYFFMFGKRCVKRLEGNT
jgi:hypothetical protein